MKTRLSLFGLAGAVLAVTLIGCGNRTETVSVPPGTSFVVSLETPLSTEANHAGDEFQARTLEEIAVDGKTIVPIGARVTGHISSIDDGGDGRASMSLTFDAIQYDGGKSDLETASIDLIAEHSTEDDVEKVAGGGIAGAVIGGVAGGPKGAAIGAVLGAGAGGAIALATRNNKIELPRGQRLRVELSQASQVPYMAAN